MFLIDKDIEKETISDKCEKKILSSSKELSISHSYFKSGGLLKSHSHGNAQITYIIKGRFEFVLDGDSRVLSAGDAVFIEPGESHSIFCLEDGEIIEAFNADIWEML